MTVNRSIQGSRARRVGKDAEAVVAGRLRALGLLRIEKIETGWHVTFDPKTRRPLRATPMEKVSGDFKAIVPGGRAVLVESKWRPKRLGWSDLKSHQIDALNDSRDAGALALLAWVHERGLAVMRWPLPPTVFRKGLTMTPQNAAILNIDVITTTARKEG